eukprot:2263161-Rhodomonas_salina.2
MSPPGRPAYRPDLEDQVSDMRSIKLELTEAKKEVGQPNTLHARCVMPGSDTRPGARLRGSKLRC